MLLFCTFSTSEHKEYRFGFNGMEKDDEVTSSNGNTYTTPFRMLDPRLGGRWWSRDPIVKEWESPYAGFSNNPIFFADPSGLDPTDPKKEGGDKEGKSTPTDEMTDEKWSDFDPTKDNLALPEVAIVAEKPKSEVAEQPANVQVPSKAVEDNPSLTSNPIHRHMQMNGITSFGSGIKWGNGLDHESEFMKGVYTLYAPLYGAMMIPALPTLMPMALEGGVATLSQRFASVSVDAVSQFSINYAFTRDAGQSFRDINLTSLILSGLNPSNSLLNVGRNSFLSSSFEFSVGLEQNFIGSDNKNFTDVMLSTGLSVGTSYGLNKLSAMLGNTSNNQQVVLKTIQNNLMSQGMSPSHPSIRNTAYYIIALRAGSSVTGNSLFGGSLTETGQKMLRESGR